MKISFSFSPILVSTILFSLGAMPADAFYNPNFGRWLNRDPVGETGGLNSYCLVRNTAPNGTDALGLAPCDYQVVEDVFAPTDPGFERMPTAAAYCAATRGDRWYSTPCKSGCLKLSRYEVFTFSTIRIAMGYKPSTVLHGTTILAHELVHHQVNCDATNQLEDYLRPWLDKCVLGACYSAYNKSAEVYWNYLVQYQNWRNAKFDCDSYDSKLPVFQQEICPRLPELFAAAEAARKDAEAARDQVAVACGTKAN